MNQRINPIHWWFNVQKFIKLSIKFLNNSKVYLYFLTPSIKIFLLLMSDFGVPFPHPPPECIEYGYVFNLLGERKFRYGGKRPGYWNAWSPRVWPWLALRLHHSTSDSRIWTFNCPDLTYQAILFTYAYKHLN